MLAPQRLYNCGRDALVHVSSKNFSDFADVGGNPVSDIWGLECGRL
jgi:hypothetical protein